jgi:signal transduction histidine kinase/CheY-like chemotaxis protein
MDDFPSLPTRLRAEQVAMLFNHVALAVIGAAVAAVVLVAAMAYLGILDEGVGIPWAASIVMCALAHLLLRHLYYRAQPGDDRWKLWAVWFTAISLAEGLGWGWGSVALAGYGDRFAVEMVVMLVALGVAAGAIPAFGSYLPAFFALFLPTTVPSILWSFQARHLYPEATIMLLLMVIYVVAVGALGVRANQSFRELMALRIRTNELASDLRKQKELAERASLAKSSFLAAASHDLRQPVHALGLYVGALRGVSGLPSEAQRLIERIDASTTAMDSLFSAILDISRLDAGVVDCKPVAYRIQPLLDRICAEYAEEARGKSVTIIQHRCSAAVYTDPLLLERILRNLISNAIRYTDRGRVVVGCRRRSGTVRVEVWDTGPGIPEAYHERVFEEYFQLQNPERDRSRGLGLGLAIVRRLSALLDCPLLLRSAPGRGSCFGIVLPLGDARLHHSEIVREISPPAAQGLILVIDDEVAIQDAMGKLLKTWGYAVITAGSGGEMLEKLAECRMRPDILVCDYRLRGAENGIEVVARMQAEFNEVIPAILITGDTAEDRLIEASRSGLLLLHKPVPNGRLRAAITNLIANSERSVGADRALAASTD